MDPALHLFPLIQVHPEKLVRLQLVVLSIVDEVRSELEKSELYS